MTIMAEPNPNISIDDYMNFHPTVEVETGGKKLIYYTPSKMTLFRCKTILTQEPETIDWINTFKAGETLVDIGANVGTYSIWAAIIADVRVYSFEPESQNYAILTENIRLNNLQDSVTAFCAAIGDKDELGDLFLGQINAGGSGHTYGQSTGHMLQPMDSPFRQGCISFTLDELIAKDFIPSPDHIKVDVDGIEHKVIRGLSKTLENSSVKSVLIELNTHLKEHQGVIKGLKNLGFKLREDVLETSLHPGDETWEGLGNHIFYR